VRWLAREAGSPVVLLAALVLPSALRLQLICPAPLRPTSADSYDVVVGRLG
jgi:hypothetical protein